MTLRRPGSVSRDCCNPARFVAGDLGLCGYKARHSLAGIYRRQRRDADAEAELKAAVAERPDFEPAWLALCDLWSAQKRTAEIEQVARRLSADASRTALAAMFTARASMLRGDLQSAKRVLSEAAARDRLAFWPRAAGRRAAE